MIDAAARLKQPEPAIEIIRYADPFSWQSWCMEPVVRRLEEVWGDELQIEYRMGGLFDGLNDWMGTRHWDKETAVRTIRELAAAAGMPIHADYLWRCGVKTTYPACLAYEAAELQDPKVAHPYFRRMMEAFMLEDRPASHDEFIRLGGEVGLSASRIRRDIEIPLVTNLFDADRGEMASTRDASFDSLLIYTSTAHRRVDGFSSKPYEDAIRAMAPEVPTRRPSDLGEYAERRRSLLPAREIAEVFEIPDGVATDRLTTIASAGMLESVSSDVGAFWRWKDPAPDRLPLNAAVANYIPTVVPGDIDPTRIFGASVRALYAKVAVRPFQPQAFPIGPDAMARLGYAKDVSNDVPMAAIESFSGVGNLFVGAEIEKKDSILDVGCGSGTDAFLAAARLGRKGTVHGFDLTPAMVAKAKTCVAEQGSEQIEIQEGAATSIPLPDESADVALCNGVLHLVRDKPTVLREILRVLHPEGRLAIASVVLRLPMPAPLGSDSDLWSYGLAGAPLQLELTRMVEAAGFQETRVVSEHDYFDGSAFPAVRRLARAVGARSVVVSAVKPKRSKKRR